MAVGMKPLSERDENRPYYVYENIQQSGL